MKREINPTVIFRFLFLFYYVLHSTTCQDYSGIKFWHPFDDFKTPPLPTSKEEYISYKDKVIVFLNGRNKQISERTTNS